MGLPLINFKIGEIKVDKHTHHLAKNVKKFIDERVDYGLKFNMSDKRVTEEIIKPMQLIAQNQPILSALTEIK